MAPQAPLGSRLSSIRPTALVEAGVPPRQDIPVILKSAERIEGAVARTLLHLPDRLVRRLAGPPIQERGRTLDPSVQLALRLNQLARKRPPHEVGVKRARRDFEVTCAQVVAARPDLASVSDEVLAGRPVRIYRPHGGTRTGAAVLYFHGGGFVVGSLDSHDAPCRELAARARCVVIAVDYRLAPEHPFPAAVDDARDVFRAAVAEAERLGIDPRRVAVGGDSAGGNLSAVCALDTRHDAVRPCLQLLIYPVVDMTMSFPSIRELGEGYFLERETIAWYRDTYLGGAESKHPRASPLFVDDLSDLPPALVITAGFDPLRDEGDAYAKRLREAGVAVTHQQQASLFHGFWSTTQVMRGARRAFDEAVGVLRASLEARSGGQSIA